MQASRTKKVYRQLPNSLELDISVFCIPSLRLHCCRRPSPPGRPVREAVRKCSLAKVPATFENGFEASSNKKRTFPMVPAQFEDAFEGTSNGKRTFCHGSGDVLRMGTRWGAEPQSEPQSPRIVIYSTFCRFEVRRCLAFKILKPTPIPAGGGAKNFSPPLVPNPTRGWGPRALARARPMLSWGAHPFGSPPR